LGELAAEEMLFSRNTPCCFTVNEWQRLQAPIKVPLQESSNQSTCLGA
jgi:hypothetical protein